MFLGYFKEAGNYNDDAEIGLEEDLSSSDDELLEYKDPSKYKKPRWNRCKTWGTRTWNCWFDQIMKTKVEDTSL